MAFVKVKLDEIDIDVENLKKRIDHKIQNSSPKQTLLSEAIMHDGGTCAFDENSNTLFFSITPMSLLYRDGYDCCVMIDSKQIIFIECDFWVYKDHSVTKCNTINSETDEMMKKLREAKRCLHGNDQQKYITLNNIEI